MHIFAAVVLLTFMALPPGVAGAAWGGGLVAYYALTSAGEPEHTGRREWPAFAGWLGGALERALPAWLGSFQVVVEGLAAEYAQRRLVFGYLHHGLYPLGELGRGVVAAC